ncbi:hypothetical protein C8J56DRAFT_1065717 [Mycena floridula]|nr:hypothetical protein C8J56DRAFT_1065717 [Mycena floridula]
MASGYIRNEKGLSSKFNIRELGDVLMVVEDTNHFQMEDNEEWDLLSPGHGLVYLGENHQPFMPSMFHQLRCLNIIRKAVLHIDAAGHSTKDRVPTDLEHHCVNYLRQMVLCRGDLHLDDVRQNPRDLGPKVFLDSHQCKDWQAVYREVQKNQKLRVL